MNTTKLRELNQRHLKGRTYDWSKVNDIIDGKIDAIRYNCGSRETARKAYLALRYQVQDHKEWNLSVEIDDKFLIVYK